MKNITLSQKILVAVIGTLLFVYGVVATCFFVLTDRDAGAFSSTAGLTEEENAVVIPELWNGDKTSGSFTSSNVKTLIQMISNSTNGTVDIISSQIDGATANNQGIKMINATTLRGYDQAGNVINKSIVVTLGGFEWLVTCLSKDSSDNVVVTLLLNNNLDETSTYCYTQNSQSGPTNNFGAGYPSGMYGTSYMRAVILNNGGGYVEVSSSSVNPTSIDLHAEIDLNHRYGIFTHNQGALYNYIVQPKDIPYQTVSQGKNNGQGYVLMNESLANNLTGYYGDRQYQTNEYYTIWGADKLWLPSLSEIGPDDTTNGIWKMVRAERVPMASYDYHRWTRSGLSLSSYGVYGINGLASNYIQLPAGTPLYVRPAMHLNLTKLVNEITKTITLDQQSGNGGTPSVTVWTGDVMPNITVPAKTGYAFGGYFTGANGTGEQYYLPDGTSTKTFTESSPTTLYANWIPAYILAYNGNGATGGSTPSSTHAYGTAQYLTNNGYTKTGYSFLGWATSVNGEVVYANAQSVINLTSEPGATITLYAKWIANNYKVTFDYGGAVGGDLPSSKEVIFGSVYGDLPLQTKAGEFIQWYLDSSFVNRVTSTTIVSTANDHTLYAKRTTWLTVQVVDISSEVGIKGSLNIDEETAKATITPANGYYISEFSFDNANFYTIDSYSKSIGDIDFALRVTYIASTKSNMVGFNFEYLDLNYLNSQSIKLYLRLTTDAYSSLKQSGGSVEGVNVTATYGGMVSMIGDNFDDLVDDDTITFIANECVVGYGFSHWENASGVNLGTDSSIRLAKSVVMNNIIKAVFVPVDDSLINGDKNN